MHVFPLKSLAAAVALSALPVTAMATTIFEEVVVTADFRRAQELDYAASLSVVGSGQIRARAAQHLDEVLNVAPNVNFAAGASRGRYIQVRGIGERSQFVDPINPSVGLAIDGVDLSGVGNAGTLFDVQQVEVLRGPQGTRFGASALAGMVNIISNEPTATFEGQGTLGFANYDSWRAGLVLSGPLSDRLTGRVAVEQYTSDGFVDNAYLARDDTGERDEATARARLRWQAGDDLVVDVSLLHVDVDNGYDAFSLDNNRTTLSDEPGRDAQQTQALGLTSTWTGAEAFTATATLGAEQTEVDYGFDEDWTNTAICDGLACDSSLWGFDWWYSSSDRYLRDRDSRQLDLRLVSTEEGRLLGSVSWVGGLYINHRDEDLERRFFDWDLFAPAQFASIYDTRRHALYGELSVPLAEALELTLGGRVEDFSAAYKDSRGVVASPDETLWGGEVTVEYRLADDTLVYGLLSRGYKAGGVNGEALGKAEQSNFDPAVIDFIASRLVFDTETARNLELGVKGSYMDQRWRLRLALFAMERDDIQLKGWYNDGPLFVGYTDNGASGTNRGVELETAFAATDSLDLFASLGLLDTEIRDFYILGEDGLVDQSGRDQAHAPGYQFNLAAEWQVLAHLTARLELDGKDGFYFSDSHQQRSSSHTLVHGSVSYTSGDLTLRLWGRNLGGKDYPVRGFYFPNDPRAFYEDDRAYVQLGDPRTYGLTATYNF